MKNEEKFKTVEERKEAFKRFCVNHECITCPCNKAGVELAECRFIWLSMDYKNPKPDLPFEVADKVVGGCNIEVVRRTDTKEEVASFLEDNKFQCDRLNDAALAWHERMCKEEKEG